MHRDGAEILAHACKHGCETIVSLRLGSRCTSEIKNASVVCRQAEEGWGS
jgi:hypothetical protein